MKLKLLAISSILVVTLMVNLPEVDAGKMKKMMKDMMMMSMMGGKKKIIIPIPIPMKMGGGSKCVYVPQPYPVIKYVEKPV